MNLIVGGPRYNYGEIDMETDVKYYDNHTFQEFINLFNRHNFTLRREVSGLLIFTPQYGR